jgi:transcription termination factor Rho
MNNNPPEVIKEKNYIDDRNNYIEDRNAKPKNYIKDGHKYRPMNKEFTLNKEEVVNIFGNGPVEVRYVKNLSLAKLQDIYEKIGYKNNSISNQELVFSILKAIVMADIILVEVGILEVLSDGFGFLRAKESNYLAGANDIYVSPSQIKKFGLKTGDYVKGEVRTPKSHSNEKYFALLKVDEINSVPYHNTLRNVCFDSLVPIFPEEKLNLEVKDQGKGNLSCRLIDLIAPIGKGQRSLIVAPPRTGKTILMKNLINAITTNHPEMFVIVLLIGERPEEVTDIKAYTKGEVISSTFDEPASRHVQISELVMERAKRLVENKKDVVIFLDSITRLARAYNAVAPSSGKVLSGGVDSNALHSPKRFFGAARNIKDGGSLTIIASALVETGSRMDEVIFEEFKGTGNSEIVLDRRIADRRIYPALDISKSGTRREELLLSTNALNKMWVIRKLLSPMSTLEQIEYLIPKLKNTETNADFFEYMNSKSSI